LTTIEAKKNIIVIGAAYPYRGGIASFTHRLAEELHDHNCEVQIITFVLQYPNFLFPGKTQINSGPNPTSIPITRLINSVNPLNWLKVGRKLMRLNADMIIFQHWMPFFGPCYGTVIRMVKKNNHTKIVCVAHNILPHEKRMLDNLFNKYFIPVVDKFMVLSESVKSDLHLMNRNISVDVSPHPIYDNYGEKVDKESACKKLNLSTEFRYLLFFGFIRKYKGLNLLIDAMDDSYFTDQNIKLIIAGEYYENEEIYKNQISQITNPDVIIQHTTFIPDDHVKYYFSVAELVVQPYISATQSGISQLAIGFEVPMVVTDVGGLKEILGDKLAGEVVNPDVAEIRSAIIKMLSRTNKDEVLQYLRSLKNKYSWNNFASRVLQLDNQ
jgi:glycosyltransferase involved in cell wall biosynthesis